MIKVKWQMHHIHFSAVIFCVFLSLPITNLIQVHKVYAPGSTTCILQLGSFKFIVNSCQPNFPCWTLFHDASHWVMTELYFPLCPLCSGSYVIRELGYTGYINPEWAARDHLIMKTSHLQST